MNDLWEEKKCMQFGGLLNVKLPHVLYATLAFFGDVQ